MIDAIDLLFKAHPMPWRFHTISQDFFNNRELGVIHVIFDANDTEILRTQFRDVAQYVVFAANAFADLVPELDLSKQ